MNESLEELQQLAGEYVLGTLPLAARLQVERRIQEEPLLRAEVDAWERRLLPLTALAEPVEPSTKLWPRIVGNLRPQAVTDAGGWRRWWDDLRLWRSLAGLAMVASFVLASIVLVRPDPAQPAYMVVLVSPQERNAGYVVQASLNNQLTLTPLEGTPVPSQKSLQFWTKGKTWSKPESLGLVTPNQPLKVALGKLPQVESGQLFEITLEPEAGSPTGLPTGPILYIGRAVKVKSTAM
jgi:anti-sigma-K factor RskA